MRLVFAAALTVLFSGCGERVLYVPMSRLSDGARADCTVGPFSPPGLFPTGDEESAKREFAVCLAACRKQGFLEDRELPPLMAGVRIDADGSAPENAIWCGIRKQK